MNLQTEESRFREIVERATEVIFTLNKDGMVTYVNPAVRKLTGYAPEEWVGKELAAFVLPEWQERVSAAFREQLKEQKLETKLDFPIITRHGMVKWVEQTMTIFHHQGETDGARAILRDVTERVKAEEARKKLKSMQADFVSMVTHELRTPLTSILGYIQLLLRSNSLSHEQRKHIEVMDANSRRLRELVDDVLQVSKLETGRFEYQPEEIDLGDILEEVADTFAIHAKEKKIKLECEAQSGFLVCADRARLIQVFSNLISNAIKYTERGKVTLRMFAHGDRVSVEVSDTGFGISDDDQKELFQRFFRSNNQKVQKTRGMGLGLFITKEIVEQHKGDINLESELGRGTTIRITLPLSKSVRGEGPSNF